MAHQLSAVADVAPEVLRLPCSEEIERSVLGALLLSDGDAFDDVPHLDVDDFWATSHRIIFKRTREVRWDGGRADAMAVMAQLEAHGELEKVGGFAYLSSLSDGVPSTRNVAAHAAILRERRGLRDLIATAGTMSAKAQQQTDSAMEIALASERTILSIVQRLTGLDSGMVHVGSVVDEVLPHVDRITAAQQNGVLSGLSTGLAELDKKLGGLRPGLVIVAGRPSMGKTDLACQFLLQAAYQGKASCMFSLEMSRLKLTIRLACHVGGVDRGRLLTGWASGDELQRFNAAATKVKRLPIYIDDSGRQNILSIRSGILKAVRQSGVALAVIDYLTLMDIQAASARRDIDIGEVVRQLKILSGEIEIPIVLVAQLNRKTEDRPDKRPQLGDLKECGDIEQHADVVLFPFRAAYYDAQKRSTFPQQCLVIIAKHRDGPPGDPKCFYDGRYGTFADKDGAQ